MGFFDPDWMGTKEDKALAALDDVTGNEALLEVVRDARLQSVRLAAIARIDDDALLAKIALSPRPRLYIDENPESVAAVKRIESPEVLSDVFLNAKAPDVVEAAEGLLATRCPNELAALRQRREVAHEEELLRLVVEGVDATQRLQALMDSHRDEAAIVALDDESKRVRVAAIGKVRDLNALVSWLKRAKDAVPEESPVLTERLSELSADALRDIAGDGNVPASVRQQAREILGHVGG